MKLNPYLSSIKNFNFKSVKITLNSAYPEPNEVEINNVVEYLTTEKDFLNRTLLSQASWSKIEQQEHMLLLYSKENHDE